MTFLELLNETKSLIKYEDTDYDTLIKSFLNYGYKDIARKVKSISINYVPIIRGIANIPDGFDLVKTVPELAIGDKVEGRNIITSLTGTLEMYIVDVPDDMTANTDEPDIPSMYHRLITFYGAYKYYLFKKNVEMAGQWLNEYLGELGKLTTISLSETYEIPTPYSDLFQV